MVDVIESKDDGRAGLYQLFVLAKDSLSELDLALHVNQAQLAVNIEQHRPEHNSVAQTYNNKVNVLEAMGKYDEATVFNNKALAIKVKPLGPAHPSVGRLATPATHGAAGRDAEPV